MAFGSTNNKEEKSTNTRGIQFKNKNGFDPCAVSFSFWNDMLSIRMNPALPENQQSNTRVYDYDKTVSTALSATKISLLLDRVTKIIVPAIEAGEDKTVGIVVGGDSLVCVGTGKAMTGEIRPYISIHKSLNQDTMKPEMSIYYEFNKEQSIDDYNAETGKYKCVEGLHAEFITFIAIMKASVAALTNAETHVQRYVNQYSTERSWKTMNSIAEKLGIPIQNGSGGVSYSRNNISFSNSSSNSSSYNEPIADTMTINDINAIDEFLS